jgi:predicted NUDIX family NTP pyrophosphohydrolase
MWAIPAAWQAGGKTVFAFAFAGDCDVDAVRSNTFELEWPPHSGDIKVFPEIDKAAWFSLSVAREKINQAQIEFLDVLERKEPTTGDDADRDWNTPA